MRVLVICSPYASHLMPMVPLVWGLRARGHDAVVLGQPDIMATAHAAGLPSVSVGDVFDVNEVFHFLPPGLRPIELGAGQAPEDGWTSPAAASDYAPWIYHSKYVLEPYLRFARRWRPDLVLADSLDFSGLIIGGVLSIPVVQHRWGAEPMTPAALATAKTMLGGRAVRHGLPGVPDPDLALAPSSPAWAVPESSGDVLVRPMPYNGGGEIPAWVRDKDRPRRMCVSFGLSMIRLNGLSLVRTIAEACDGLVDAEAVVTLDGRHTAELGPVPDSVRVVAPMPVNALMGVSDVACHHGGGGSALTALAVGIPQLMLPQMMDEHVRCERIEASGAGLMLGDAAAQNSPATLRAAIESLLGDDRFRKAAVTARDEAEKLPSPAQVAQMLENIAAPHGRRAR
ncbi:glycosyltransferase [Streptomyces inhibens]|uniref:glycosyltransferase n=1 Tax=Streptomyces inhibens TaxID=2293571 RepID=UPI001EE72486|nr:glycosyltransferase [Streptomyces inhibens]UKY51764.1 glycosyltransferase [Streptomyces inhibens]